MNKAVIYIGAVLCLLNLVAGLVLSAFNPLNVVVSTLIILLTCLLMVAVDRWINLKSAYKVSLSVIVPAIGVIQYLLAAFMPGHISDNWCVLGILLLIAVEAVLIVAANSISKKIV